MAASSNYVHLEPFINMFQSETQPDTPSVNSRLQRGIFRRLRRKELKHTVQLIAAYKENIYQQYAKELQNFDYPDISDHSKYNILDTSGIYMKHDENILLKMSHLMLRSEAMSYHSNTGWYAFLPCFQNGFMHYADAEDFYFQIRNINENLHQIKIQLLSCSNIAKNCPMYLFAVEATVTLPAADEDVSSILVKIEHLLTHDDIYRLLSETDMHWNSLDTKFWNIHLQQFQTVLNSSNSPEQFRSHIEGDIRLFFQYNLMANHIMSKEAHNASAASTASKTKSAPSHPKKDFKPNTGAQTRTTHTFSNNLKVHAPKDWKPVKSPKVLHYTMESWPVRGHIRHYKNGKTVYIKPRINRRKGSNGSQPTGTTTINIKF